MARVCIHVHYCRACSRLWNCVRWACNKREDLPCESCVEQSAIRMEGTLTSNICPSLRPPDKHTQRERRPLKVATLQNVAFNLAFTISSITCPSRACAAKETRYADSGQPPGASQVPAAQKITCNAAPVWRLKGRSLQARLCNSGLVIEKSRKGFFSKSATENADHETNEDLDSVPSYIPLSSINAVIEEVAPHKPVQTAIDWTLTEIQPANLMDEAGEAGEGAPGIVAVPIVLGTAAMVMAPFRGTTTHQYSIRVLWVEHGESRSTKLDLSSKDAGSLANQIATRIDQNLILVQFDKSQQNRQWILVNFPSWVSLGPVTSQGGTFRFLTIKCSDGNVLVYVFRNESKFWQDPLLVVRAESQPLNAAKPWRVKLGRNSEGISCVKEVDTDTKQLRVDGCPVS